jgi:hypothetical protein
MTIRIHRNVDLRNHDVAHTLTPRDDHNEPQIIILIKIKSYSIGKGVFPRGCHPAQF